MNKIKPIKLIDKKELTKMNYCELCLYFEMLNKIEKYQNDANMIRGEE